jgi:hypothetical protein
MDDILFVLQKAREGVCKVLGQLFHPIAVGLLRNPHNFDLPCSIINTDQNIITGQSLPGIDFLRKKINGRKGFPMGFINGGAKLSHLAGG